MQKMLWQFLNYKDQLLTSDLVLFSQTKAERNLHFKDFPMPFQIASINGPIKNSILGISKTGNVSSVIDKSTDSAIINWFTDDRIIWDFIGSLHSLEYFKQFYNLFLIPTMSLSNVELQYYNKELFEKELNSHPNLYLGNKGLDDFAAEEEYLCWGHPVESVHERFANYLYKELTNV
jgi:hypothetical protein